MVAADATHVTNVTHIVDGRKIGVVVAVTSDRVDPCAADKILDIGNRIGMGNVARALLSLEHFRV